MTSTFQSTPAASFTNKFWSLLFSREDLHSVTQQVLHCNVLWIVFDGSFSLCSVSSSCDVCLFAVVHTAGGPWTYTFMDFAIGDPSMYGKALGAFGRAEETCFGWLACCGSFLWLRRRGIQLQDVVVAGCLFDIGKDHVHDDCSSAAHVVIDIHDPGEAAGGPQPPSDESLSPSWCF